MVRATWKLYAYLNSAWVDITDDVIRNTSAEWGLAGNRSLDMVGSPGSLEFDLNNYTVVGKYSPEHPNTVAGWKKGVFIKQVFTYEGEEYVRFFGFVDSFSNSGPRDEFKHIVVMDWLEYAARHSIVNPGILENQRAADLLNTVLGLMPIRPQATDFDLSVNLFTTTFDVVTSKTKGYDEAIKAAYSEVGYVYLKKAKNNGDTLVFDNARRRNAWATLTDIPLSEGSSGFLKKEDSSYLLKEDGGKIILNQLAELHLDDSTSVIDYEIEDGENLVNYFSLYAWPRRIDTSLKVLFQLDTVMAIGSGKSITIKGNYVDPTTGLAINGQGMVTPVATTDYLMNTEEDGTGTNITTDLVVTASYGAEGFEHVLTNNNSNPGYITKFNCRGFGIYIFNPVESVAKDDDSIDEFDTRSESLTQKYKNGLVYGSFYTKLIVEDESQPRTILNRLFLSANKSGDMMLAFLNLDVGDMIWVTEERSNIDKHYYIQSVSYQTMPAGIIMFQWVLRETRTLEKGLESLAVEFRGGSSGDAVDFDYLPQVVRLPRRSFSVWIYADTAPVSTSDNIMGPFSDGAGVLISLTTDRRIQYYSKNTAVVGVWQSPANSVPLTAWTHVVVTMDIGDGTNDPVIYINGTLQSPTETATPSGALRINNEIGAPFVVGNWKTATEDYTRAFDGKIQDPRVYNRILSQADVTTLYNAGTPDLDLLIDDTLVFQGFIIRSDRSADYIDQTLTSDTTVRDTILSVLGVPHGGPIGRAP